MQEGERRFLMKWELAPPVRLSDMAAPLPGERGMLSDVVNSVFEPGTNAGLVRAMSYSFYALFVTLLGMAFLTGGNLHVVLLLATSIALFTSIKWFIAQIAEAEEKQRQERLAKEKTGGKAAVEADPSKGKTE